MASMWKPQQKVRVNGVSEVTAGYDVRPWNGIEEGGSEPAAVEDGWYTVVHEAGTHTTLRVKKRRAGSMAGKVIVSALAGGQRENAASVTYQAFGHVGEDGYFRIWRAWTQDGRAVMWGEAFRWLAAHGVDGREKGRAAYALRSGRCAICNRVLTDPASLVGRRGVGPECAKKIRLA